MDDQTIAALDAEFAAKIAERCSSGDQENDHADADGLLCELLTTLGAVQTVAAFGKVGKWYA